MGAEHACIVAYMEQVVTRVVVTTTDSCIAQCASLTLNGKATFGGWSQQQVERPCSHSRFDLAVSTLHATVQ